MSKRTLLLSSMLCVGVGLGACSGGGGVLYGGSVSAGVSYGAEPPLIEVEPDIWVVEGYDEPVFYVENSYWLYRSGNWYRSSYYDRGWIVVYDVPYRVRGIDRPTAYVRYRGHEGSRWRQGPRGRVIVRDHRNNDTTRYDRRAPSERYVDQQRGEQQRRQENLREERRNQAEMERRLRASREQEQQRQQTARQQEREQQQNRLRQERERNQQMRQEQEAQRQREQLARQQERQQQQQHQREQRQENRQDRQEQQKKQQQKKQKKQKQNPGQG